MSLIVREVENNFHQRLVLNKSVQQNLFILILYILHVRIPYLNIKKIMHSVPGLY